MAPVACVSIDVDTQLYSVSATMRAAYKFSGRFHVALQQSADPALSRLTVTLRSKSPSQTLDEETLRGDFLNELLDQRLRETLEAEFGSLRELIVAQAFADTNLLDPTRESADYVADPLNIGEEATAARSRT
jgi:His-Xaa-Ser system protein HxsD